MKSKLQELILISFKIDFKMAIWIHDVSVKVEKRVTLVRQDIAALTILF